jgi:dihydroorotate dehydrogenase
LTRDQAVINRFGFNSEGHSAVHARLAGRGNMPGIVGINLGANKDSPDRTADYVRGIEAFVDVADYFTINISSPNTPGLRDLQLGDALDELLARVLDAREAAAEQFGRKPVLVKIAPDLSLKELDAVIKCVRARRIDGLIVSNTTLARPATLIERDLAREPGGLSGRPLFALSTQMLAAAYLRVENQFPLIGVGGVDCAEAAFAKIEAGASLVQLYTSFVFKGLPLAAEIKRGLLRLIAQKSYPRHADAIGSAASDWASGKVSADSFR